MSQVGLSAELEPIYEFEETLEDHSTFPTKESAKRENALHYSLSTIDSPKPSVVEQRRQPLFTAPSERSRQIGNFHDYYLELGQWPELATEKEAEIACKYKVVKQEYQRNQVEIQSLVFRKLMT